ncbi:MAG: Chaperone protein HscA, partial [Planctomycetota bacterium]
MSDSSDSKSLESGCDADQKAAPRYIVGIDLGTTNCALCWTDTEVAGGDIRTFAVPQIVSEGQTERLETLPSFHLDCSGPRQQSGSCRLPWQSSGDSWTTGVFARDQGRLTPGRVIESAKSWLCHPGVDRRAAILPWHGAADVARLSPVEASARCLQHLRAAWNAEHPQYPLEQQDVVLTIPASFDEVAREL